MCSVNVQVRVVPDDRLGAPWAVAIGGDGQRILFVSESARPADVADGYAEALRACPVRMALEFIA